MKGTNTALGNPCPPKSEKHIHHASLYLEENGNN